MPLFYFNCGDCKKSPGRALGSSVAQALLKLGVHCKKCGAKMVRTPKAPTANVVERLDNAHMPRAVERPADAERLYAERSKNDPSKDK